MNSYLIYGLFRYKMIIFDYDIYSKATFLIIWYYIGILLQVFHKRREHPIWDYDCYCFYFYELFNFTVIRFLGMLAKFFLVLSFLVHFSHQTSRRRFLFVFLMWNERTNQLLDDGHSLPFILIIIIFFCFFSWKI